MDRQTVFRPARHFHEPAALIGLAFGLFAQQPALSDTPTAPYMQPGPYAYTRLVPQPYARLPANTLIQCRPVPTGHQWAGPFPAVILIHGGYWAKDDATQDSGRWCRGWASWGFVAFSINYRLIDGSDSSTWWPAPLIDAQAAIRWVRANAAALNINKTFVGAFGDSAGGQIAMMLGYTETIVPGDLAADNRTMDTHAVFVVSEFGPSTFGPPGPYQRGAPTSVPQTQAANQITRLLNGWSSMRLARTMFVQGANDSTVWPSESQQMYCLLVSYGRGPHYVSYNGGHEFAGIPLSDFDTVVGGLQAQAVSFAYGYAHLWNPPALPASLLGPQLPLDTSPPACP